MKTYKDFLEDELQKAGHDVIGGMDYLDIVFDEVEKAAVLYSLQNSSEMLTDIGRVIYNPDKPPMQRINEIKALLAFKYRRNDI